MGFWGIGAILWLFGIYSILLLTSFLLKKNVSIFNLGGGLTDEMGDYLFKFKKNFSKRTSEFYIGKRIHNNNKYSEITEDWISIHGNKEFESKKKILQFYR